MTFTGADALQLNLHLNLKSKTETPRTESSSLDIILRFREREQSFTDQTLQQTKPGSVSSSLVGNAGKLISVITAMIHPQPHADNPRRQDP